MMYHVLCSFWSDLFAILSMDLVDESLKNIYSCVSIAVIACLNCCIYL